MIVAFVLFASKRRSVWVAVVAAVTLTVATAAYRYWSAPRLNIVLVTFDTTRADRLGTYGYKKGQTRGFDEFARRGVVFERAYAPAPLTLPSHATMLTGLYPPEHGLRVNGAGQLNHSLPLLSEILQERGYDTGAFIAAAVLDSMYGLDRGFGTYNDDLPRKKQNHHHEDPRRDGKDVVDAALAWLQQRTSRPFFCWIHLFDAHGPYDARLEIFGEEFLDSPYDAGIAWEIRQFDRVTKFLKDNHFDPNTLVIVVGDHGEGLDEHLESEHGMLLYNTTLHVPFVFVGPHACQPGTRVPTAVSLVDLTPTVLDLLSIPAPQHVSGRSLLPALKGNRLESRDCYAETHTPFVYNHWSPLHTVISERWKYIQSTKSELFDLQEDPGETRNLIDSAGDALQEMRSALELLQEGFVPATAQNLRLSEKDLANLRALGYVAGGKSSAATEKDLNAEVLPDVKDMLPLLAKFDKARHLSMQGNLEEPIALLQEIVDATSEFPAAGVLLGECLAQAGRLDEAIATYQTVLQKRPDFTGANFTLGKIFANQGRLDDAIAQFRAFIKQDPGSAPVHFELGNALLSLQKFDEALGEYREAIRIAPDFVVAHVQLGQLLMMQRRPAEAINCFEKALEADPSSALARASLMTVLVQTGQPDKALQVGRQGVAVDPESFEARFNFGILLVAQRRYAEGIAELRAAQRLNPDDPRTAEQIQQAEAAAKRGVR